MERNKAYGAALVYAWALGFSSVCSAAEYIEQESPAPSSTGDMANPINAAFSTPTLPDWGVFKKRLDARLEDSNPFFRDARTGLDLRTFSFDRTYINLPDTEDLAIGGKLWLESGQWNNLSVRAAFYNSTKIDTEGTASGLLTLKGDNINVWAEANVRYQFDQGPLEGAEATLYRQTLNLPFLNKQDTRMLPNTHEGYVLQRSDSDFDFVVGHFTRFKNKYSDDFDYMSVAAGALGSDDGVSTLGVRIPAGENISMGVINHYGWNTFSTTFIEATHDSQWGHGIGYRLSGQFTDQRSVGDELVGDFNTWHTALQGALSWRGGIIKLAGSTTSDKGSIKSPWGGKPSYLSLQRLDFDSAGEDAVLLGGSYNTEYFSSMGLSSFVNIAHGWNRQVAGTSLDLPDRTEYDLTIDYKPPSGMLRGLWARFRVAYIDTDVDSVRDIRLIINYDLPLL